MNALRTSVTEKLTDLSFFLEDLSFMVSVSFHNPKSNSTSINSQISCSGGLKARRGTKPAGGFVPRVPNSRGHRHLGRLKPRWSHLKFSGVVKATIA